MSERRPQHLSEEQLARYRDGHLAGREASHLEACAECGRRLRDLEFATAEYRRYLNSLRAPTLLPPPRPWRSLDSLIAENQATAPRCAWRWRVPAFVAAICLAVAVGFLLHRPSLQPPLSASELLSRSATMELAENRMVSLHLHGRSLVRPAVLVSGSTERDPEMAHLAMLFAQARYSWRDPLSARSFQSWRSGLREKRDSVTLIHGGSRGTAFRVRTDTPGGILRSAALTLSAKDLHPTHGDFQFEGEEPLQMQESATPPPPPVSRHAFSAPKPEPAPVETPASPADALHVLAALNAIGADVGEPVEISEDSARQVLVRATGLSRDRLQQIAAVLKPLAHVKLAVGDATTGAQPAGPQTASPERSSTGMPAALRQQFEDRLGSATALQEMTDRVLEASGLAVARVHAIEVLVSKFPPPTESALSSPDRALLDRLRQGHISALDSLTTRIAKDLEPILPLGPLSGDRAAGSDSEPDLVTTAQQVDNSLNRLLAGSYSEPTGKALLNSLAGQLANLRQAIALQSQR
jgi:hypothetical protein